MVRLVTVSDKEKYPELNSKGVSVNQYYDFSELEAGANGTTITDKSKGTFEVANDWKQVPEVNDGNFYIKELKVTEESKKIADKVIEDFSKEVKKATKKNKTTKKKVG